MATERLSATLSIGSVLEGSIRRNVSVLRSGLDSVGDSISKVARRQKELEKNRKVLEREGRSVEALDREYEALGRTLDQLRRKQQRLEAVSKGVGRVGRDLSAVGRDIRNVSVGLTAAAGAAGAAIFGIASSTAALGDNVAKTADRLGLGIDELQELRYAAERSGVSVATLDMATQRMTRRIAEAARGSGEAKDALKELGLNAVKLRDAGPAQAYLEIADAIAKIESPADRVRLSMKLFDSEGVALVNMLKDGSSGLQQLRRDAQATGYVLSEKAARDAEYFQDRLLDTQLVLKGLKNTVGAELMPVISDAMSDFSGWARTNQPEIRAWAQSLVTGLETALPVAREILWGVADVSRFMGRGVAEIAEWVGGWRNLGVAIGVALGAKTLGRFARLVGSTARLGTAIMRLVGMPALFSAATATMAARSRTHFATTAASAEASAARVSAARSRMMGKAAAAGVMGALALSGLPDSAEGMERMQAANRERIEGFARNAPILGSLMEAYDAALRWRTGADEAAEATDGVAESADRASGALGETPAAGEAFSAGMSTVSAAAARARADLEDARASAASLNGELARSKAGLAGQPSALGLDRRSDAARDYPYHPGSAVRRKGQLVPGGAQRRAGGGSFMAGPLIVGEEGEEALWASRGAYVSKHRELQGLRALAQRTFADLARVGSRAGAAPAASPGGAPIVVNIHGSNLSADEVLAAARREERRRNRRALHDAPSGLGQYGAG